LTWHTYGERNAASQVIDIKLYGVSTKTSELMNLLCKSIKTALAK